MSSDGGQERLFAWKLWQPTWHTNTHTQSEAFLQKIEKKENDQRALDLLVGNEYFICDSFFLYGERDEQHKELKRCTQ